MRRFGWAAGFVVMWCMVNASMAQETTSTPALPPESNARIQEIQASIERIFPTHFVAAELEWRESEYTPLSVERFDYPDDRGGGYTVLQDYNSRDEEGTHFFLIVALIIFDDAAAAQNRYERSVKSLSSTHPEIDIGEERSEFPETSFFVQLTPGHSHAKVLLDNTLVIVDYNQFETPSTRLIDIIRTFLRYVEELNDHINAFLCDFSMETAGPPQEIDTYENLWTVETKTDVFTDEPQAYFYNYARNHDLDSYYEEVDYEKPVLAYRCQGGEIDQYFLWAISNLKVSLGDTLAAQYRLGEGRISETELYVRRIREGIATLLPVEPLRTFTLCQIFAQPNLEAVENGVFNRVRVSDSFNNDYYAEWNMVGLKERLMEYPEICGLDN